MKIYDDLYVFISTAKSPSFSLAAKDVGLDQSSLSSAISRLENRLKKTLFIRKKTGIELTKDGVELYNIIYSNLMKVSCSISEFTGDNKFNKVKEIKIITTTGTLCLLVIDVIEKFKEDFPNIIINIRTIDGPITFLENNADLALLPTVLDANFVTKRKVKVLNSQMFCSDSYIQNYGKPKTLESLKNHKFIGYYNSETGYKGNVDWHLKYSKNGKADIKINLASAQILAAERGLGIIAIPREIPLPKSMVALFPEETISIPVYIVTRRGKVISEVDSFIKYINNYLAKENEYENEYE